MTVSRLITKLSYSTWYLQHDLLTRLGGVKYWDFDQEYIWYCSEGKTIFITSPPAGIFDFLVVKLCPVSPLTVHVKVT